MKLSHFAILLFALLVPSTSTRAGEPEREPTGNAMELIKGLVVSGTFTQVIGTFTPFGLLRPGDTVELDVDHLPREKVQFQTKDNRFGGAYLPFPAPLKIVRAQQGPGTTRAAIHLSSIDPSSPAGQVLIQILAESLKKGSKVRVLFYRETGFTGSMAEAEGILK